MRHLLLVEDSVELAENLAEILREADFDTRIVHSAEQALGALDDGGFDGIISDLRLPRKTGVELLQHVRARGLDTPVILMSAFADEHAQTAARLLGALAVLVKPFDCARLLRLLSSLPETQDGHRTPRSSSGSSRTPCGSASADTRDGDLAWSAGTAPLPGAKGGS